MLDKTYISEFALHMMVKKTCVGYFYVIRTFCLLSVFCIKACFLFLVNKFLKSCLQSVYIVLIDLIPYIMYYKELEGVYES